MPKQDTRIHTIKNVQSDWLAESGDSFIKNKPDLTALLAGWQIDGGTPVSVYGGTPVCDGGGA